MGDGNSIGIWNDPWVNRDDNFYVETPPIAGGLEELKVISLITMDGRSWNMFLLNELLLPVDVDCILRIPISMSEQSDRLIWHFSNSGKYVVKSGHYLLVNSNDIFISVGLAR